MPKYSILNIFSGIELLLKEKLKQEHWSLVFEDVSKANKEKFLKGDFVSVNHGNIIKRLKGISNITVNDKHINELRILRNQFEHFEAKMEILKCKEMIALSIREVIIFWEEYFSEECNEEQYKKFNLIKKHDF